MQPLTTEHCCSVHYNTIGDSRLLTEASLTRSPLYLIGDAASRCGLSRVGYFMPLNGRRPLNGHPPSTIRLDKLIYYGIRGIAYNLLRSYLANMEQFVELNDTASKTLPIVTGVPHGSILGPLLFLIYINDFPLSSNLFKFIMYADDTTL